MRQPTRVVLAPLLLVACIGGGDDPPSLGETAADVLVRDLVDPSTGGSAHDLEASTIIQVQVELTKGRTELFDTANRTGGDPVLHILGPALANGPVNEVARDDDGAGNRNARILYTPLTTGIYTLVLRATYNGTGGRVDLRRNQQVIQAQVPFGGAFQRLQSLRVNEELMTVPLPRGPGKHALFIVDDNGRILERHLSGDNQGTYRRLTAAASVRIAMIGVADPSSNGPLRLVRNDRRLTAHDYDEDLLGNELEADIATCSTRTDLVIDFACSDATDPRDTDGDGLRDDVELLGATASAPYQLLPRWGANPRHKDLFLEVDFLAGQAAERTQRLLPAIAAEIAAMYADPEPSPLLRLLNATTLRNPDLEPGVNLHFDLGLDPPINSSASWHRLHGNWGGHNRVEPVCSGAVCSRANALVVWHDQMHPNRHGLFHYIGGTPGTGGQAPAHSVANAMPMDRAVSAAHELAHTFGVVHNGADNGDTFYANCKPTYPSLANYAYMDGATGRFSDGLGRPPINNTQLDELGAVPSPSSARGQQYLTDLRDVFGYLVDLTSGDVDWDRDGVFSADAVRAYANDTGTGCEFTRYNRIDLSSRSTRSPALAHLSGTTLMLSIDADDTLVLETTEASLTCPPADTGCGAAPRRTTIDAAWNRDLDAIDAHRIVEDGEDRLLVVYRSGNRLWEVTYTVEGGFDEPRQIAIQATPIEELSITGDDTTVYLVFKESGGQSRLKVRTGGVWSADELVRDSAGLPIASLGVGNSPALLLGGPATARVLYAIFPLDGQLALKIFNPTTRLFDGNPWMSLGERAIGKAAMAWVPMSQPTFPGRLHLMWLQHADNGETVVRQSQLVARPDTPSTAIMSSPGHHDNVWLYGYGLDLLFDPTIDTNLLALLSTKVKDANGTYVAGPVQLRPKADGIVNVEQRNWNDWEVMRSDLCRTLVWAAPPSTFPIRCPAWIW